MFPKRNTSKPHPDHPVYPYLLRGVEITHSNQVWSTDITYIKLKKGFVYLAAVIDWKSRYVLSYRLSNTLTPEIFNTDQGSQFTSDEFITVLKTERHHQSLGYKTPWMVYSGLEAGQNQRTVA